MRHGSKSNENGERLVDGELARAARRGDKRAFVEIVARHQAMVCGIALGILGDFAASEDAAQEAFLTAWRKFHDLREPERLRPWLAQIARNAALGHLRRTRGHEALDESVLLVDESPGPDESAASKEETALVGEALSKLPELYRLPLVLYYRQEQSVREVAEALGVSEDAVKQRLARGREMLRERMSVLVESVLSRTAPNAIFTMAVAMAIGALTAPAAVAASAFAAASGTASVASATSTVSTQLITAMSTTKSVFIAAAVAGILLIPVGYQIAGKYQRAEVSASKAPAETELTLNAPPTFENSALFAEWRELHEKHGTNSEAMPVIYKAISDIKDFFRRRAFRSALIAEWAQVDPSRGLAFFLEKGRDVKQGRQFIEEWLALDPNAALDALLASSGWEEIAREALMEIARRAPSRVGEIVSRLPSPESYWDVNVQNAFAFLAENGLGSTREMAESVTGPNRERALSGVAKVWAKNDFDGTVAWAKALPAGTDRDEIVRAALLGKAAVDPIGALDSVGMVPSGGKGTFYAASTTAARVLSEAAKADFDATVAWVTTNPGRFDQKDLTGLDKEVTDRLNGGAADFLSGRVADGSMGAIMPAIDSSLLNSASGQRAAVWEWLKTQPDNEATKSLREAVLNSAGYQDPEFAIKLVADLPPTAEGDAQMKSLAQHLLNAGAMLFRFDKLFEQAPDRLKQTLVETAFNNLSVDKMDDPQAWIGRLSQLPEGSRTKGIESIARAWAWQTPEEAIGWVESLEPGEARAAAAAITASTWGQKDPYAAAEWVASMPPGAERDRGAASLALKIAEDYPSEAWQWATSVEDAGERNGTAKEVIKMIPLRDDQTVRQWIEAGPFTPEVKNELQTALATRLARGARAGVRYRKE
jgi:RNA polymerase sigma factor (sigma-70 family)